MTPHSAGLWTGELDGLIGRDEELGQLRSWLRERGHVAVVLGIAGAGKTAMLDVACRAAAVDGVRVVRVTGHIAEQGIAYAALTDLLGQVAVLPVDRDWTAQNPLRLRLDVLARLEEAAESPLLVAVDDSQWIDASSLSVLAFLANRLASVDIAMVVAVRGDSAPVELQKHPRIVLGRLDENQSLKLLRRSGLLLSPFARAAVIERAGGNPLALLQLGRAAAKHHRVTDMFVDDSDLSDVEQTFAQLLPELPEATRARLLIAAAGATDLTMLAGGDGAERLLADLAPAESAGLIRVTGRELRFHHPLARSAVYASATASQRLAAHQWLAEAYTDDPDRRSWHLAEASLLPDHEVAESLVTAAERARSRGAAAEAARLMTRAAELSVDRRTSELRMLEAVTFATPAGHFDWIIQNATRLRDNSDDPEVRARAMHHIAYVLAQTWQQRVAHQALIDALDQLVELGADAGWASLTTLASLTYQSGEDSAVVKYWLERYQREAPLDTGPLAPVTEAAKAWIQAAMNPLARPAELVRFIRQAPPLDTTHPPDLVEAYEMLLGGAAWILEEQPTALARFSKSLAIMRRTRAGRQFTQTLSGIGQVQMDGGLFDEADETGRLLCDIAEAENLSYIAKLGAQLRGRVAAIRGDTTSAVRLLDDILLGTDVGENLALEARSRTGLAHALFSGNDMPGAYDRLRSLFHADGQPLHEHISYHLLGDLASTAVRAGRLDDAREVVAAADRRIPHPRSLRHQLIMARARAVVSVDERALDHFEAATRPVEASRWPFELANARLDYGAWLRRFNSPVAGRAQLSAALETFERLGARAWISLTRSELRAAGVPTAMEEAASAWASLTAQERQVVKHAAAGMSNPQIGRLLFLSPRTVGAHLYNAFPKLGVTARSQLRDIVEHHQA